MFCFVLLCFLVVEGINSNAIVNILVVKCF